MTLAPYFQGREGHVAFSASSASTWVSLGKLTNFRINVTRGTIPITNFDSAGWEQNLAGIANWNIAADAFAVSTAGSTDQAQLRSYLSTATRSWLSVFNSTVAGTTVKFQGYGWVTGWELAGGVEDAQTHGFEFSGDGVLVEAST